MTKQTKGAPRRADKPAARGGRVVRNKGKEAREALVKKKTGAATAEAPGAEPKKKTATADAK